MNGSIVVTANLLSLAGARTVPLVLAVPVLGGPTLSIQLRLATGLGLAVLCMPALTASPAAVGTLAWFLLAAREAVVGLVMGFVVACAFRAAEAAGRLNDLLRGSSVSSLPAPAADGCSTPLGSLFFLFAAVVFFEIGGVGYVGSALGRSYEAIPLSAPLHRESAVAWVNLTIVASAKLIEAAIGLAAPAIVALLLADIALGILGRALPRLPLHAVAAPLRSLVALGAVLLGLGAMDMALQAGFRGFFALLASTFGRGT